MRLIFYSTTVPAALSNAIRSHDGFPQITFMRIKIIELSKEASNILLAKSTVTAASDAVWPDNAMITPTSYGIDMNM
jgi:hypothetical protein